MTGQERGAPGAAEGRPLLHAHLGPHQTEAAHPALETLWPCVPVPLTQRHSLVLIQGFSEWKTRDILTRSPGDG